MADTMKHLYEIINFSDAYTLESDDEILACVATIVLGEGHYGLKDEAGKTVLPILAYGGAEKWIAENVEDLGAYLKAKNARLAVCLESVIVGSVEDHKKLIALLRHVPAERHAAARAEWHDKKRTSMNDIGARAWALAMRMRQMTEEESRG